jgi:hypothetical protein
VTVRTNVIQHGRRTVRVGSPGSPVQSLQPCRRKFLRFFPRGFQDETYVAWERGYKEDAHRQWEELLGQAEMTRLLDTRRFEEIAARAVRIESRTNLLFSFEKMALRDAVRTVDGARRFAEGLHAFLYGTGGMESRFEAWCHTIEKLPRKQTRVLTWPLVTVFGFVAQSDIHFFLKPNVTRTAALHCAFNLHYASRPSWAIYRNLLDFAEHVRRGVRDLKPKDMIDIQSFIWVQGSNEYD